VHGQPRATLPKQKARCRRGPQTASRANLTTRTAARRGWRARGDGVRAAAGGMGGARRPHAALRRGGRAVAGVVLVGGRRGVGAAAAAAAQVERAECGGRVREVHLLALPPPGRA